MDTNNWSPPAVDTAVVTGDWRAQLAPDSRPRIVNKIMETLKRHLPFSGQEGLEELKKIAIRFEEKIYFAAESQQDYLRKISLKMLTMESKSQNTVPNPLQSNSLNNNNSNKPLIQSQLHNQGQLLPMQLPSSLQSHQQLLSQNTQNNTASAGVQASLDSTCQTGHADGGDWQEEVYQKIKALKETYLAEVNEMSQKIAAKFHQIESLPQPPKREQVVKLKVFNDTLERIITFLHVPKHGITPNLKEKLASYEKQIIIFTNSNRLSKPPSQQLGGPGQILLTQMHSMQQSQSQITQIQSHENSINPHAQSMNLQGSAATMRQSSIANLQHSSLSQQNMMNSLQPGSNLDSGQGNAMNSMQQVPEGSLEQNPVSAPQQANVNTLSTQSGVTMLQQNINPLQSNPNLLQHQHLKQQQEQKMLQTQQQLKQQYQQRQMLQQQFLQQQQLHGQARQQMPAHQIVWLHQMNDVGEMKMRQGMGAKPGMFQEHLSASQRPSYPHQQLKSGASFPTSSPQLLQAASPQMPQHFSPQVDQQNLLSSLTKSGTPFQSANSSFVVPSPSTLLARSPMPVDSEKPISGISSNAGNIGLQQKTGAQAPAQSPAIGTPGISASPLLAEFTSPDGSHATALINVPGKSSIAPNFKEKLGSYENQIINFLNSNRPRKPPSQHLGVPGQILPTQMHSMQQSQCQITQIQSHDNLVNPHAQSTNLHGSAATMQQNLQHSSQSQQKMMNVPQPGSNMVSTGQGYALISMQWAPVGSSSQKPVRSPQQASKNGLQHLVLKLILILLLVIILFQLVSLLRTGESTYSMAQFPLVKWFGW